MQAAEHQAGAIAQSLYVGQDREHPPRERDGMFRFAFIRAAGMVQTPASRSISSHVARTHLTGARRRVSTKELERRDRGLGGGSHSREGIHQRARVGIAQ